MIERIPTWLRWLIFVPASLAAGFAVAGLLGAAAGPEGTRLGSTGGYLIAFASGAAYVVTSAYCAFSLAPGHKHLLAGVLCLFIVGDLTFIHLVAPDLFSDTSLTDAPGQRLSPILDLLRAEDYRGLPHGGPVRVIGAVLGVVALASSGWRAARSGSRG